LKKEAVEKLAIFCKSPDYPAFVRQLIVQGLIKIEEQVVEIQCRAEDKTVVSRVVCFFF
jgi:vacuolar-type H+-ATPase subunit E/Vma4